MQPQIFYCLLLAICLSLPGGVIGQDVRQFILPGRESVALAGEVVGVVEKYVTLKVEGEEMVMPLAQFSVEDQAYFRDWRGKNLGVYVWLHEGGVYSDGSTQEGLGTDQPEIAWRAKVGIGDGGMAVTENLAVTAGILAGRMVITALDPATGKIKWTSSYPLAEGARDGAGVRTPAITINTRRVFSVGPSGRIDGWNLDTGKNLWATTLATRYPDLKPPLGGFHPAPLSDNGNALVEVGGSGTEIVAMAGGSGSEIWRAGDGQSLGATPAIAAIGKRKLLVCRNVSGVAGRDLASGKTVWAKTWEGRGHASPLVFGGEYVFLTSAESCSLFRLGDDGKLAQVWSSEVLCSDHVRPVFQDGYLFGFDGDALTCVSVETGQVAWSQKGIGAGGLTLAGRDLLVQTGSSGELLVADASGKKFTEQSRIKVFDGPSRTPPILVNGQIYCRSAAGELTVLDARSENSE